MREECNQSCSSCAENCNERTEEYQDFTENLHEMSSVKKVIAVMSGKGGVGKSFVTSMLAAAANRQGYRTAILDADITGPSIPKMFGLKEKAVGNDLGIFPVSSRKGVDIMSINFLLPNDTDPVVWRGPIIAGTVKQFWSGVIWNNIDYMFIDMPPGTGDVPLTVFQSIPVDGIVVVTSPQELVSMIVEKALNMAKLMKVPLLGIVENMSYFRCPDNGKEYKIFGESKIDKISEEYNLKILEKFPIDPDFASACDKGEIEGIEGDWFNKISELI